jgi:hypothetical protein
MQGSPHRAQIGSMLLLLLLLLRRHGRMLGEGGMKKAF